MFVKPEQVNDKHEQARRGAASFEASGFLVTYK